MTKKVDYENQLFSYLDIYLYFSINKSKYSLYLESLAFNLSDELVYFLTAIAARLIGRSVPAPATHPPGQAIPSNK